MKEVIDDLLDVITPNNTVTVVAGGGVAIAIQYMNLCMGFCIGICTLALMFYKFWGARVDKNRKLLELEEATINLERLKNEKN